MTKPVCTCGKRPREMTLIGSEPLYDKKLQHYTCHAIHFSRHLRLPGLSLGAAALHFAARGADKLCKLENYQCRRCGKRKTQLAGR